MRRAEDWQKALGHGTQRVQPCIPSIFLLPSSSLPFVSESNEPRGNDWGDPLRRVEKLARAKSTKSSFDGRLLRSLLHWGFREYGTPPQTPERNGHSCRPRTYNTPVNSRMLYH